MSGARDDQFPTTSWGLLDAIRNGDSAARAKFAQRYRTPILRFFERLAKGNKDAAEEMTQDFYIGVVFTGKLIAKADAQIGRFRDYLKQALRNFFITAARRGQREKGRFVHPDDTPGEWEQIAPALAHAADRAFEEAWVEEFERTAETELEKWCIARKQAQHFKLFKAFYLDDPEDPPSWKELGARFGLDADTARNRAETAQLQFARIAREMVDGDAGPGEAAQRESDFLCTLGTVSSKKLARAWPDRRR
jgi:DNA-directed RNA polymerase specialized sigma24 family protein